MLGEKVATVVTGWPGLQVDGYDEIPPDGSGAKGNLAFDFQNLKFTKEGFSHNDILAELQKALQAQKQLFPFEKATIENRQWSIPVKRDLSAPRRAFKLRERFLRALLGLDTPAHTAGGDRADRLQG